VHQLPCIPGDLPEVTDEESILEIEPTQEQGVVPLLLEVIYKPLLVSVPNFEELPVETFAFHLGLSLNLRQDRSEQLEMSKPLTLIINVIRDKFAEVPIAIMDPLPGVDPWLNQNERLVDKTVEFLQRRIFLLKQDIPL
jgi:hypothetical protein